MDIFVWKLLLKNLVLPPTGALLIVLAGCFLAMSARYRRTGLSVCATGALLLWLLSTPAVADALLRAAERYRPLDLSKPVDAQAIVILGGGARPNAPEYGRTAPGSTTLARIVYGALVARATGLPVLVTGSHYEAAAMSNTLQRELDVTPRWVESRSHDTHENALYSHAILAHAGVHRIVLVTSAAHMARAVREFQATGMAVLPAPTELWTRRELGILVWVPNVDALVRAQRALYEMLGRVVQTIRFALEAHDGSCRSQATVPSACQPSSSSPRPGSQQLSG